MGYRLRQDLHWCMCSGRIVFLDIREDRYSCLPTAASAAFVRVANGETQRGDIEQLRALIGRGMLVEDAGAHPMVPQSPISEATKDFAADFHPSATISDHIGAVAWQLHWSLLLRSRSLANIVKRIERPARQTSISRSDDIQRIISAFSTASLLLPSADRCLVRALAFHSICGRRGIHPLLVFGVRLDPFRAHCWVQLGGEILIGEFEQVRLFKPILSLG